MTLNVLPLSWFFKCLTFSKKNTAGFLVFIISSIEKNKLPSLLSLKPFLYPAWEKGWQGNPAQRISKSGIFLKFTFQISPANKFGLLRYLSLKFAA